MLLSFFGSPVFQWFQFSCVFLCFPVFSCVFLCFPVFSCIFLCFPVFSCGSWGSTNGLPAKKKTRPFSFLFPLAGAFPAVRSTWSPKRRAGFFLRVLPPYTQDYTFFKAIMSTDPLPKKGSVFLPTQVFPKNTLEKVGIWSRG